VVGLDLGGTKLRGALADCSGQILAELEQPTSNAAPDSALHQMIEMVRSLASKPASRPSGSKVSRLASRVSSMQMAASRCSPNVAFDRRTPLGSTLEAAIGTSVDIDNDGNLAACWRFTAGRGRTENTQSLAFLTIGTGVGMGLIVDGNLLHGRSGAAGEIGYLPFGADPFAEAPKHPVEASRQPSAATLFAGFPRFGRRRSRRARHFRVGGDRRRQGRYGY
jgi:glucokinase